VSLSPPQHEGRGVIEVNPEPCFSALVLIRGVHEGEGVKGKEKVSRGGWI